ncbi:MAG: hypothetical protein LUE24_10595 [Lachnospiraceae bacterium]|nr:hypothetical protein [Lachnospiraceae bacterium]
MDEKKKTLELWLTCIILEGFLLYGETTTAISEAWPLLGNCLEYWLYFMYLLVLVRIAIQKKSWLEWLVTAGILGLVELTRITTQTNVVLWFAAGLLIAKDVDLVRVLKADLLTRIVMAAMLIVLPLTGLYHFYIKDWGSGRVRYSFGWSHPNEMGLFFLMLCMAWAYLRYKKWCWKDNVAILLLLVFLDRLANSRTAEICMLLLLLLENLYIFLGKRLPDQDRRLRLWKWLAWLSAFGVCILTFILFIGYSDEVSIFRQIPATVSGRFSLAHRFWSEQGFSLLGQVFDGEIYNYLDMLYAYLSLNMGILVMAGVLFLNVLAVWRAGKERDEGLLLIIIVFQAYSLLEHEHFKTIYGFYPLLLGYTFWPAVVDVEVWIRKKMGKIIGKAGK